MCSAVRRRTLENGTTRSPAARDHRLRRGDGARLGAAAGGGAAPGAAGRPGAPARQRLGGGAAARPFGVLGVDVGEHVLSGDPSAEAGAGTWAASIPLSARSRRTIGDSSSAFVGRGAVAGWPAALAAEPGAPAAGHDLGWRPAMEPAAAEVVVVAAAAVPAAVVPVRARGLRLPAAADRGCGTGGGSTGLGVGAAAGAGGGRLAVADDRQAGADLDGLALGHDDLGQHAAGRRRDLGVDLVGRHLEERLVPLDLVADRLHPSGDRPLGDGLAELRHRHVRQGGAPFR